MIIITIRARLISKLFYFISTNSIALKRFRFSSIHKYDINFVSLSLVCLYTLSIYFIFFFFVYETPSHP